MRGGAYKRLKNGKSVCILDFVANSRRASTRTVESYVLVLCVIQQLNHGRVRTGFLGFV